MLFWDLGLTVPSAKIACKLKCGRTKATALESRPYGPPLGFRVQGSGFTDCGRACRLGLEVCRLSRHESQNIKVRRSEVRWSEALLICPEFISKPKAMEIIKGSWFGA